MRRRNRQAVHPVIVIFALAIVGGFIALTVGIASSAPQVTEQVIESESRYPLLFDMALESSRTAVGGSPSNGAVPTWLVVLFIMALFAVLLWQGANLATQAAKLWRAIFKRKQRTTTLQRPLYPVQLDDSYSPDELPPQTVRPMLPNRTSRRSGSQETIDDIGWA